MIMARVLISMRDEFLEQVDRVAEKRAALTERIDS